MIFGRRGRGNLGCADECAAFLEGQALRIYETKGLTAPPWAHLNWIAHGDPSTIVGQVRSELGLRRLPETWPWAISTLAKELTEKAGTSQMVIRLLQRECLIPMELALLGNDSGCFLPKHLVALGVPRLRAHPITAQPDSMDVQPDK